MKILNSLLLTASALISFSPTASAASTPYDEVSQIAASATSWFYIFLDSREHTCVEPDKTRFVFKNNTDAGEQMAKLATAAYLAGKTVKLTWSCVGNNAIVTYVKLGG